MHFCPPTSCHIPGPYCNKNVEALLVASKKFGLEVNSANAKCIFMSREYNRWQNYNMKIGNKSTESVAKFMYVGTTVTNQNCMLVECKNRLHS